MLSARVAEVRSSPNFAVMFAFFELLYCQFVGDGRGGF
jgi:hypothetical protein